VTRELATRLAADKGDESLWGAPASPQGGDGVRIAGLTQGRFHGVGNLPSATGESNTPQVTAEVVVHGATVVVNLSVDAKRLDADCNAPAGAMRAAVLTALGEVFGAPPWAVEPLARIETGGRPAFDAAYPAAVGGGARVAFGCYLAVAEALREAGAANTGAQSFREFSGEDRV
jgi:hypothetical protein